jgi:hypothetical protein
LRIFSGNIQASNSFSQMKTVLKGMFTGPTGLMPGPSMGNIFSGKTGSAVHPLSGEKKSTRSSGIFQII